MSAFRSSILEYKMQEMASTVFGKTKGRFGGVSLKKMADNPEFKAWSS